MTSATPQQPEPALNESQNAAAEENTLPAWHKPAIARIEIKRTMFEGGSGIDSSGSGPTRVD